MRKVRTDNPYTNGTLLSIYNNYHSLASQTGKLEKTLENSKALEIGPQQGNLSGLTLPCFTKPKRKRDSLRKIWRNFI